MGLKWDFSNGDGHTDDATMMVIPTLKSQCFSLALTCHINDCTVADINTITQKIESTNTKTNEYTKLKKYIIQKIQKNYVSVLLSPAMPRDFHLPGSIGSAR